MKEKPIKHLEMLLENINEDTSSEASIRNSIRAVLKIEFAKIAETSFGVKTTTGKAGRSTTDIRFRMKPEMYKGKDIDEDAIKNILLSVINKVKSKLPTDFKFVKIAAPGDMPDAASGTFPTFIFQFIANGKKAYFKIINSLRMGKTVGLKEFTPDKVLSKEIINTEYNKSKDFLEDINRFVKEQPPSSKIQFIKYLIKLATDKSPDINLDEISTFKDITVSGIKDNSDLDDKDKNAILTDFGEIFVGLVLGENGYNVGFPQKSNFSIIDLRVKKAKDKTDIGIGVSVKKDAGARASITGIIQRIDDLEEQSPGVLKKFKGAKIFNLMKLNTVIHIPALAAYIAKKSSGEFSEKWEYFKKFIKKYNPKSKIDFDNLENSDTKEFIETLSKALGKMENLYPNKEKLLDKLNDFEIAMGKKRKAVEYKNIDTKWGYLLYPLRVAVINALNEDTILIGSIKKILAKLAIKQFHLYKRPDGIDISIVSYGTTEFSFSIGGSSAIEPWLHKISFKIHLQ
jgi:hypothetical protein